MVWTFLIEDSPLVHFWVTQFILLFLLQIIFLHLLWMSLLLLKNYLTKKLNYSLFRVFGCECDPNLSVRAPPELFSKSKWSVFFGYTQNYKGYCCFDPTNGQVRINHHVHFVEHKFLYLDLAPPSGPNNTSLLLDQTYSPTIARLDLTLCEELFFFLTNSPSCPKSYTCPFYSPNCIYIVPYISTWAASCTNRLNFFSNFSSYKWVGFFLHSPAHLLSLIPLQLYSVQPNCLALNLPFLL